LIIGGYKREWLINENRMNYYPIYNHTMDGENLTTKYINKTLIIDKLKYERSYFISLDTPIKAYIDPGLNEIALSDKLLFLLGIKDGAKCTSQKKSYFYHS